MGAVFGVLSAAQVNKKSQCQSEMKNIPFRCKQQSFCELRTICHLLLIISNGLEVFQNKKIEIILKHKSN